jgi:hypothetical protein
MPRWIGVFDVKRTASLLGEVTPKTEVTKLGELCGQYRVDTGGRGLDDPDISVSELREPSGTAWDSLWKAELAPALVTPRKDWSYLKWRYVDHPTFRYEIHAARRTSTRTLRGLTICRVERIKGCRERVLRVLEFLAAPDAAGPLAVALARTARTHEAIFADFYCTSERAARALELIGFRRQHAAEAGTPFPARFQPMEGGRSEICGAFWLSTAVRRQFGLGQRLVSDDFYITKADGDQDRPN